MNAPLPPAELSPQEKHRLKVLISAAVNTWLMEREIEHVGSDMTPINEYLLATTLKVFLSVVRGVSDMTNGEIADLLLVVAEKIRTQEEK